jgi:hypothetical protein
MEIAKAAGEEIGKVAGTLGKNYAAALISQAFLPALTGNLEALVEDAKEQLGKGGEAPIEDALPIDKEEKEADTFLIEIDSQTQINTDYGTKFMAYSTFIIRIGNVPDGDQKEKPQKKFYVNAQHYRLRYEVLARAPEKANQDHKDLKAPPFVPRYEFGGTCCFCITKAAGDPAAHLKAVQDYYKNLFDRVPGYSPSLADWFRIGDDYEAQQAARTILLETISNTLADLGVSAPRRQIEPFTETEMIAEVLQAFAEKDILPKVYAGIPGENQAAIFARNQARNLVLSAVEAAAKPWDSVADKAREASVGITKKVQESAGKIADLLKEPLAKIVGMVQEKMKEKEQKGGDEEKEEPAEEKKGVEVGDIAKNWVFTKTEIGRRLDESLDGKQKPSEVIKGAVEGLKAALTAGVRGPLEKAADAITCGGGGNRFVVYEVRRITNRITNLILELTTLDGFLESSIVFGDVLDGAEEELGKAGGDKEKATKAIDGASHALWEKGLKKVAMTLWTRIFKLQERISSVMASLPDAASQPLIDLLSHIFEVQLRAFNGIRVQYVRNLREGIGEIKDAESACRVSRAAFKGAVFPIINLLGYHHWIRATEKFYETAKILVMYAFNSTVWPAIKSGLDALQSLIPEELGSMGLKLEPLVRAVIDFIIDKGLTWAMNKIFLAIERLLFTQE